MPHPTRESQPLQSRTARRGLRARPLRRESRARFGLLRRALGDERGTQLVELAIAVPLFLMLVGAVAEFGRFFYTYSTLAKATRAGARYQISQPPGASDSVAKNLVVYGNAAGTGTPVVAGLTTANVQVVPNKTGTQVQTVTVKIDNYTYEPIFDLGKLTKSPELSLGVNVGASSTMRQLVQ